MTQPANLFSMYEDFLKNFFYTFTYFPTTNWQHAFSPRIYFGSNVEDADVEQHVLSEVGSYGKQLNRVLDVLTVIVSRIDRHVLTPQELHFVDEFERLARRADEAAAEYQGKRPHGITHADVNGIIDGMRALEHADKDLYQALLARLYEALPLPTVEPHVLPDGHGPAPSQDITG